MQSPNVERITFDGVRISRARHKYTVTMPEDDEQIKGLPSVTKICKIADDGKSGALMRWAVNNAVGYARTKLLQATDLSRAGIVSVLNKASGAAFRARDEAGDYGQIMHGLIDDMVAAYVDGDEARMNELLADNPDYEAGLRSVQVYLEDNQVGDHGPVLTEAPLLGIVDKELYVGTADLVYGTEDGAWVIVDWKTSGNIYHEVWLQLGGYAEAWRREHDDPNLIIHRHVLHIPRTGTGGMLYIRKKSRWKSDDTAWCNAVRLWSFFQQKDERDVVQKPVVVGY